MTTDNTVAEIKAARDTALGSELDRHACVQFSDTVPPFGNLAGFLIALTIPMLSVRSLMREVGARQGDESIDLPT
jgi:hypothetical protein